MQFGWSAALFAPSINPLLALLGASSNPGPKLQFEYDLGKDMHTPKRVQALLEIIFERQFWETGLEEGPVFAKKALVEGRC